MPMEAIPGEVLCPIGRIEKATEDAIKQILAVSAQVKA
jgi:hypothetical protein